MASGDSGQTLVPTEADLAAFSTLLPALRKQVKDGADVVRKVRGKFPEEDVNTLEGISFLELKNQLMLNYLQNLTFLMLKKASGVSIKDDPATLRIVEIRTVLERMRPMEKKLRYHIDKLLNAATSKSSEGSQDPLSFRPNPDLMVGAGDEEDEGVDNDESEVEDGDEVASEKRAQRKNKARDGVYVPPKMSAVPYSFEERPKNRTEKAQERAKHRALHSTIMQELRQEYYDEPEEVHDGDIYRMKADKRAKEREAYEERTMTRLNVSKKDKAQSKRMATMSSLSHIADFNDFRGMDKGDDDGGFFAQASKKRKNPQPKKGKKSKKFKKRR
ncbi:hypothetical protein RvY_03324 [Ramazzottius varieornatus]|uniref:Neuroguidin n=1 Tax=Ramazzottius varieornatus TaxID=947166 RepID=A0A1D1UX25_RAMVA|nr:hypothetical protein RvY_03324 [Ramazzottius varieornatus]